MSYMSEQHIALTEARDLCGYDSLECERDHFRDLLERALRFMDDHVCHSCRSVWEHNRHIALEADIKGALARINKPERDAESKPDTSQG